MSKGVLDNQPEKMLIVESDWYIQTQYYQLIDHVYIYYQVVDC